MIAAFKRKNLTSLQLQALHLRDKELTFWKFAFTTMASQSALLAGFSYASLNISKDADPLDQDLNRIQRSTMVNLSFLFTTSTSMGFGLLTIVISTLCGIFGPGLALRGPDGPDSVHKAVETLKEYSEVCFNCFVLQLVMFMMSSLIMMWLLYPVWVALTVNIILVVFFVIFVLSGFDTVAKLHLKNEDTVESKFANFSQNFDNLKDLDSYKANIPASLYQSTDIENEHLPRFGGVGGGQSAGMSNGPSQGLSQGASFAGGFNPPEGQRLHRRNPSRGAVRFEEDFSDYRQRANLPFRDDRPKSLGGTLRDVQQRKRSESPHERGSRSRSGKRRRRDPNRRSGSGQRRPRRSRSSRSRSPRMDHPDVVTEPPVGGIGGALLRTVDTLAGYVNKAALGTKEEKTKLLHQRHPASNLEGNLGDSTSPRSLQFEMGHRGHGFVGAGQASSAVDHQQRSFTYEGEASDLRRGRMSGRSGPPAFGRSPPSQQESDTVKSQKLPVQKQELPEVKNSNIDRVTPLNEEIKQVEDSIRLEEEEVAELERELAAKMEAIKEKQALLKQHQARPPPPVWSSNLG